MSQRRSATLGAVLVFTALLADPLHLGVARGQTPSRSVVRLLIASAGGFDQRNFAEEYARSLPGIELKVITNDHVDGGTRLEELQTGEADLTINASQTAYLAFSGQLETTTKRYDRLRAISMLGVVPLHLVVAADSGIRSVTDLRGHSVNVGIRPGENYRLALSVLEAFGLTEGTYRPHFLTYADASSLFTSGGLEAMFVVGSYPGRAVIAALKNNRGRLVPIEGPPVDRLRLNSGFLYHALIPAGTYQGQTASIRTIGTQNIIVCRSDLDEGVVYELTKQLFVALPRLAPLVTSIRLMDVNQASATSIPLHDGAARYYRERELLR